MEKICGGCVFDAAQLKQRDRFTLNRSRRDDVVVEERMSFQHEKIETYRQVRTRLNKHNRHKTARCSPTTSRRRSTHGPYVRMDGMVMGIPPMQRLLDTEKRRLFSTTLSRGCIKIRTFLCDIIVTRIPEFVNIPARNVKKRILSLAQPYGIHLQMYMWHIWTQENKSASGG
jgi:hypothetical protein